MQLPVWLHNKIFEPTDPVLYEHHGLKKYYVRDCAYLSRRHDLRVHLCGLWGYCKAVAGAPPTIDLMYGPPRNGWHVRLALPYRAHATGWHDIDSGEEFHDPGQRWFRLTVSSDRDGFHYVWPPSAERRRREYVEARRNRG